MSTLVMAPEKKPGTPPKKGEKPTYTTFRIYEDDGANLSELADKRGKTIADLFRELYGADVKRLLIVETKKRLQQLEDK
jgi:hypothetical protein